MADESSARQVALKICGVTTEVDARACLGHRVDYIGFNLYPGSKRYIPAEKARAVWQQASAPFAGARTQVAAVFVDPGTLELAAALAAFPEIDVVQMHVKDPGAIDAPTLRRIVGKRALWLAMAVACKDDVVKPVPKVFDLVLFDSAAIASGHTVSGGSGEAFDWQWLASYPRRLPFALAGGIGPGRVARALAERPAVVDLCSRIERAPGHKDLALLEAVVHEFAKALEEAKTEGRG